MEATEWLLSCKLIRKLQIMYSLFDENLVDENNNDNDEGDDS